MPCYDPRNSASYSNSDLEVSRLRKENNRLTRMLCGLCSQADPGHIDIVPGLRGWWEHHKRVDALLEKARKITSRRRQK